MKIVQAFDQTTPLISGYSMRSRYISESLQKMGIDVTAVRSPSFDYKCSDEVLNAVTYTCSQYPWFSSAKIPVVREMGIVSAIKTQLSKVINTMGAENIDLIDAHSSVLNGLAAAKVAQKYNKPFLYQIRAFWEDAAVDAGKTTEGSLRYNMTRKLESGVIEKANHVTVICEGLKNDLLARGVPENKITIIPNGVEVDKFTPMDKDQGVIERHDLQGNTVIGFIGTFFEFEGLDLLIEAARTLVKNNSKLKIMLVGAGNHDELLRSLVSKYNLESQVIFTGRVNHDEILKYYSAIDVFVYPRISKRITELVTPLKPLEAMSMRRLVIGSDVGGIKELVADQDNGLLFKAHDVDDLVAKCEYAIENLDSLQPMIERARSYVENQRQWPIICEKYLKIFSKMGINDAQL